MLAPGAGAVGKVWPGFGEVARLLEQAAVPWVWAPGWDEGPPSVGCGRVLPVMGLRELCGLAATAAAWLGNDTGTSHLAAAAGAPVIAMFGPTEAAVWCPRRAHPLPFGTSPQEVVRQLLALAEAALLAFPA